jgi:hypothetical protein
MKPNNFLKLFKIPKTSNYLNQVFFSNTWSWRFFGSEIFQIPRTSRYYKNEIPAPHWLFGSDTCNAVNGGLLLSHQTHSKFTPLSACSICTWMELLASVTQQPQTNHPWFSVSRPSIWMNPNFLTLGTLLELSAMGRLAGEKGPNEKKIPVHTPSIHGCAFVGAGSL